MTEEEKKWLILENREFYRWMESLKNPQDKTWYAWLKAAGGKTFVGLKSGNLSMQFCFPGDPGENKDRLKFRYLKTNLDEGFRTLFEKNMLEDCKILAFLA